MIEFLLILLTFCISYVAYLKSKLNIAETSLDGWRNMIVFVNGKQRILKK